MTQREKIIASAYTGYPFTHDLRAVKEYIESKLGHPLQSNILYGASDEVQEAVEEDFFDMLDEE